MDYTFLWYRAWPYLPEMFNAALVTINISLLSMVIGTVLALFLFYAKIEVRDASKSEKVIRGLLRCFATSWIELARNTPALFQIFFFYYGLKPLLGINIDSFTAVLMALSFNTAGYMAENFRGGFNAIPDSQLSSARSLGMTFFQSQFYIIVPQVLRIIWHPMTNQFIWVLLMSSLGMFAGMSELTNIVKGIASTNARITIELYIITAGMYYAMAKLMLLFFRLIGWRLFKGQS